MKGLTGTSIMETWGMNINRILSSLHYLYYYTDFHSMKDFLFLLDSNVSTSPIIVMTCLILPIKLAFLVGKEWTEKPSCCTCQLNSENGVLYETSLLIFCVLGVIFNWMSLLVLVNKEQRLAIFTYLTVYTCTDLFYTIILSAYVVVEMYFEWTMVFKLVNLLYIFCTEVLNTVRIIAMLSITIDRIIHLEMILKLCNPQKHSSRIRARLVMTVSFVLCICANLPNLLIYKCQDVFLDPNFDFIRSQFFYCYNWIYFPIFYLLPCTLLIIGNIRLAILLRLAIKKEHINAIKGRRKNFNLTITATVIIVFFVLVQIPGYLTERPHLISMTPREFNNIEEEVTDDIIKIYRFIPAMNSFANFFIYILLCPPFRRTLVKNLMDRRRKCCIGSSRSSARASRACGRRCSIVES